MIDDKNGMIKGMDTRPKLFDLGSDPRDLNWLALYTCIVTEESVDTILEISGLLPRYKVERQKKGKD